VSQYDSNTAVKIRPFRILIPVGECLPGRFFAADGLASPIQKSQGKGVYSLVAGAATMRIFAVPG
jgi:hypothetical protein